MYKRQTLYDIANARFNDLVSTPQGQKYYKEALQAASAAVQSASPWQNPAGANLGLPAAVQPAKIRFSRIRRAASPRPSRCKPLAHPMPAHIPSRQSPAPRAVKKYPDPGSICAVWARSSQICAESVSYTHLAQQQVQTLSPQQILVVKLLELPAVELEDRIHAELLELSLIHI